MSEKVILEMTMEQAAIVSRACEFYMRVRNGQFSEIGWELLIDKHKKSCDFDRDLFYAALYTARMIAFPELGNYVGSHYGVGADETGDIAYDIYTVMRNTLAYYRHPEGGGTIDFEEPLHFGKEPLAKCRIEVSKE